MVVICFWHFFQIDRRKERTIVDWMEKPCIDQSILSYQRNFGQFISTNTNKFYTMVRNCTIEVCKCSLFGFDTMRGNFLLLFLFYHKFYLIRIYSILFLNLHDTIIKK